MERKLGELSVKELEEAYKRLDEEYNEEFQFRAHEENGMELHEDDFLEKWEKKKKDIENELTKRKDDKALKEYEDLLKKPGVKVNEDGTIEVEEDEDRILMMKYAEEIKSGKYELIYTDGVEDYGDNTATIAKLIYKKPQIHKQEVTLENKIDFIDQEIKNLEDEIYSGELTPEEQQLNWEQIEKLKLEKEKLKETEKDEKEQENVKKDEEEQENVKKDEEEQENVKKDEEEQENDEQGNDEENHKKLSLWQKIKKWLKNFFGRDTEEFDYSLVKISEEEYEQERREIAKQKEIKRKEKAQQKETKKAKKMEKRQKRNTKIKNFFKDRFGKEAREERNKRRAAKRVAKKIMKDSYKNYDDEVFDIYNILKDQDNKKHFRKECYCGPVRGAKHFTDDTALAKELEKAEYRE